MRKVEIQQSTFERLQSHAEPIIDSVDTVICRALDALEKGSGTDVDDWNPSGLDLSFTRILSASFNGDAVDNPNWNLLVRTVVEWATADNPDFDEVIQFFESYSIRICSKPTDSVKTYVESVGLYVQDVSANTACKALVKTAQKFDTELMIIFEWRKNARAGYLGKRARLTVQEDKVRVTFEDK